MWVVKWTNARLAQLVSMLVAFGILMMVAPPAHAGRFEAGSFTAHNTSANGNVVRINFQQAFDTIPVVVALSDNNGSDAAAIRITNISTTGFDELILEPDNFDGPHAAQNVHYVAVEPGRHVLPDGQIVEAGTASISAVQHGSGVTGPESWASVSFSSLLPGTPSVVAQIQTANSETRTVASQSSQPFVTATLDNLTASGFQVALERSEANAGPIPSAETVGWIAFPAGISGNFPDIASNTITWSTVNTGINIRGWDNGCFTNSFGQSSASAIVVAKKNSHLGGDGGWLRRCSLSNTLIGLTVDEDNARDSERNHIAESASIIAFSQSFHALLEPALSVTKASVSFLDEMGGDFALPSATVEYLITVQNSGNAPPNHDSVIITEALPPELALVITDFAAPGSGPIQFQDGSPGSGLGFSFGGLGDPMDSVSFSTDGSNFTYSPTDSGDGTDPAVTHIRVSPVGFMAPNTGSGATSLSIRLKGKIG
ncbi:MAG: H-type lectin domain-containing protein [Parasphingorhabdus sp.]|uniref:H-type lectin domain-containing protein n=2 Tax=Parasphingorhabdus sp. TaxID=2709688 RepID=UPI00329722CC